MKVLWIIPKWTLPVIDGARVATDRLISSFVHSDVECEVLCLANQDEFINRNEMIQKWNLKDVHVLKRSLPQNKIKKLFFYFYKLITQFSMPLTFSSFATKEVRSFTQSLIDKNNYDLIVLDGLHLGVSIDFERIGSAKVIYRAHNIEKDLWDKSISDSKNFIIKLLLKDQAQKVKKVERSIIENSDAIAPISIEDDKVLKSEFKAGRTHLTPLGLNFDCMQDYVNSDRIELLFIGRLDWAPNKEGLIWFFENIWPQIIAKRDDIHLNIVGSGDKSWLKNFQLKNITIHGFIDDIKDAYKMCDFTIAPIHFGSGTRIKVLESYAYGRMLISNSMGVQGSTLNTCDYIHCETDQDWIENILNLKMNDETKKRVEKTNLKLKNEFSDIAISKDFYQFSKTLL